jgi:hydroxymethylpyrimidine/phosphomethylpyrimidine kinase
MKKSYPAVLTIAGSDSSGGAGIQADIKSMAATGSYAASIITVLTAQNTQGVQAIQEIPSHFVFQQMNSIFSDLEIKAVKIGMLYHSDIIMAVKLGLEKFRPQNIVLDPVMVAKSGSALLSPHTLDTLKELFVYADLLTPNIPEAETILNITIHDQDEMEQAAANLALQFKTNVLLKGGHLHSGTASDVLYCYSDKKLYWYHTDRIHTQHTHGTGCTLSAAIASYLAQGHSLREAIALAKEYLHKAIKAGSYLQLGKGSGPVHHFFY